jgi:phage shock protein A
MALVTRLTRLFQADFHAVLDRIEEPDLQLKQAVREMQFALDQDQQRQQLLQHESGQLDEAVTRLGQQLQALDEELDICLAAEKDDLARDLVRRKLAAEKNLQAMHDHHAMIKSQQQALLRQIDEQHQQVASMKQKLELLVNSDDGAIDSVFSAGDGIRDEEIEIALLREKQRRTTS